MMKQKNEFDRVILMRDLNDHIAREYKNLLDPTRNDSADGLGQDFINSGLMHIFLAVSERSADGYAIEGKRFDEICALRPRSSNQPPWIMP